MRALLIEDNDDDVTLIRDMLCAAGGSAIKVDWVDRLSSGIARLAQDPPDAVLLDLGLPDSQGLATFEKLQAVAGTTPIIVLSDGNDLTVGMRAVSRGAQDFLAKEQIAGDDLLRSLRYAAERKSAETKIRAQQQRLAALHTIQSAISSSLDPHKVLNLLVEKVALLLPYGAGTIWLIDEKADRIGRAASWNIDAKSWQERKLTALPPIVQTILQTKQAVFVRNLQQDPRVANAAFYRAEGLVSYVGLPMLAEDHCVGVFTVLTRQEQDFSDDEVNFLKMLADQAAVAINNASLHEKIATQAAELRDANRAMADFTAMMAHDMRSPLMTMVGFADMLRDEFAGPLNDEQKKWLDKVSTNGRAVMDLIKDFLDLAKLEAGNINLKPAPFQVSELIAEVLENFQLTARRRNVRLGHRVVEKLPLLMADRQRLEQVLNNLLSNAIKFSHAGDLVEIRTRVDNQQQLNIQVIDQGVGMAAAELKLLFQKYKQTSAGRLKKDGNGLGLVICKMIVEAHHGKIGAESEAGRGSRFTVSLPLDGKAAAAIKF